MDARGVPRDAITYSATISALAKGKQWQAALQARVAVPFSFLNSSKF